MKLRNFGIFYVMVTLISLATFVFGQIHNNIGGIRVLTSGSDNGQINFSDGNEIFTENTETSDIKESSSTDNTETSDIKESSSTDNTETSDIKESSQKSTEIVDSSQGEDPSTSTLENKESTFFEDTKNTNKIDTTEFPKSSFIQTTKNTIFPSETTSENPETTLSDTLNQSSSFFNVTEMTFTEMTFTEIVVTTELTTNINDNTTLTVIDNSSSQKESTNIGNTENSEFTEENIITSINESEKISTYINGSNEQITYPSTHLTIEPTIDLPSTSLLTTSINQTNKETQTIPIINISSTIMEATTQTTEIIKTNTSLVLLGFSHFEKFDQYALFYIYFGYIEGSIYSDSLKFPVQITQNKFLRLLQRNEANCYLTDIKNKKIAYLCQIKGETQGINNIKIIPEFNFISIKPDVTISPLSSIYMDNLLKVDEQSNTLINSSLYILSHCKINKGENKVFNISGIINEPKPKFQKINLALITDIENENGTSQFELGCSIIEIINNNYIMQCKVNDNKTYNFQNAMSIIKDEILLVNFDENKDGKITFDSPPSGDGGIGETTKSPEKMGAGAVIAIIIVIIMFGYLS